MGSGEEYQKSKNLIGAMKKQIRMAHGQGACEEDLRCRRSGQMGWNGEKDGKNRIQ
jgi:hypothetical protein